MEDIFHAEKGITEEEIANRKPEERIPMKKVEGYELPEFKYPGGGRET